MLLWSNVMDNNISVFSNIIFYSIAMATILNTSPITTSEDNQNDLETDLNMTIQKTKCKQILVIGHLLKRKDYNI